MKLAGDTLQYTDEPFVWGPGMTLVVEWPSALFEAIFAKDQVKVIVIQHAWDPGMRGRGRGRACITLHVCCADWQVHVRDPSCDVMAPGPLCLQSKLEQLTRGTFACAPPDWACACCGQSRPRTAVVSTVECTSQVLVVQIWHSSLFGNGQVSVTTRDTHDLGPLGLYDLVAVR